MHDLPAEFHHTLQCSRHVRDPEVGQREAVARPAPALVQPEGRRITVRLDPFALAVAPLLERDLQQPLPEALRAREVVGGELDQIYGHAGDGTFEG